MGPSFHAPRFSAEAAQILRLLRVALGSARAGDAQDWAGVDPDVFADTVRRHKVAPFLAHALPSNELEGLPPTVRDHLLRTGAATMRSARTHASLLVELVRRLDAGGVRVLSVKGPLLARELFGSVAARSAGDLDLVVPEAQAPAADALLRSAGCVRVYPARELSPKQARAFTRLRHEFSYEHRDSGIKVELMWRLSEPDLTAELLGRPHRTEVWSSQEVGRLSADSEALYLLLHGGRHRWFRLFWLVDVAQLLRCGGVDWRSVRATAERYRLLPEALHGVWLAGELLGAPVPPALHETALDPRLGRLFDRAARRIAGPEWQHTAGGLGSVLELAAELRWARGWPDRRALLGRWLLPGRVLEAVDLPDALFPLYYLIRPARLVSRSVRRVLPAKPS